MKEIETIFLECPICKDLIEIEKSIIQGTFHTFGGKIVKDEDDTQELVFYESCSASIWPKEYAVQEPKIFNKKPRKKVKKKRLTTKKKSGKIAASKDKNEDIEKN